MHRNRGWSSMRVRREPSIRRADSTGFTLVELLVVISILSALMALLLPAIQAARESARRTACQNNLRQVGVGLTSFEAAHGKWPAGKKWSGPRHDPRTFSLAWSSFLLAYLEEETLHNQIDFEVPFSHPRNIPLTGQVVPVYLCPSTSRIEEHRTAEGHLTNLEGLPGEGLACIDYLGVSGPDKGARNPATNLKYGRQRGVLIGTKGFPDASTIIEPPPIRNAQIVDGLSHTICVTECTGRGAEVQKNGDIDALHGAWASGSNVTHISKGVNDSEPPKCWYNERIFSDHIYGAHVLMCDTSVHFLSNDTAKSVIKHLCSRDGQETIAEPPF